MLKFHYNFLKMHVHKIKNYFINCCHLIVSLFEKKYSFYNWLKLLTIMLGTIPTLRQHWVGGVRKTTIFADVL